MEHRSDFCVAREPRWLVRLVRWNQRGQGCNEAKAVTGPTGWRNGIDGTRRSQSRMRLTWDRGNFHGVAGGGGGGIMTSADGTRRAGHHKKGQGWLGEGSKRASPWTRIRCATESPFLAGLGLAFCSG